MQSSAYYAAKIKEFQQIKSNISSLFSSLEKCTTATSNCTQYTDKIIICGKVFDQDKLKEFSTALQTVNGNLNAITAECDEKIAKYQTLYEQALAWEREQAEKNQK